jgi:hypothetical protein
MKHFFIVSFSLLIVCGVQLKTTVAGYSGLLVHPTRQGVDREGKIMGADVSIYLFDVKTFDERISPAYQALVQRDNPASLIALLREVIQKFDRGESTPYPKVWRREKYEEGIEILNGTIDVSPEDVPLSKSAEGEDTHERKRFFVRQHLIFPLAFTLCLPRLEGVNPRQDLTNTRLVGYLSEKSEWLEEFITFGRTVRGGEFELMLDKELNLSLGESSELFTMEDIQEFSAELPKIPPPADAELKEEYNNLQKLLNLALGNADFKLVLSLS